MKKYHPHHATTEALAAAIGERFVPLVIEAKGGWSFTAQRFLKKVTNSAVCQRKDGRLLRRRSIGGGAFLQVFGEWLPFLSENDEALELEDCCYLDELIK